LGATRQVDRDEAGHESATSSWRERVIASIMAQT
jgi:hypothetical protein